MEGGNVVNAVNAVNALDVIGIGTPCVDLIAQINEMPVTGRGTRMSDYSWQGGGKVSTAMVALARLGARCGMVGVAGGGRFGRYCLDDFSAHGIDVSRMIVDENGETPFSIVLSEMKTCERTFIFHGGNIGRLSEEQLDLNYIASCRYLHLEGMGPVEKKAASLVRESGGKVVIDADGYRPELIGMLPYIDVFIGSQYCYKAMYGNDGFERNCRDLCSKGPEIVVFTLGEEGCVVLGNGNFYKVPGFKLQVADTNGAGDVYHGAFIYGLLQGWDVRKTAVFANAVSAIKCTRIGGRAAIPSLETVNRFLSEGIVDYGEIDERVKAYRSGIFTMQEEY